MYYFKHMDHGAYFYPLAVHIVATLSDCMDCFLKKMELPLKRWTTARNGLLSSWDTRPSDQDLAPG